MSKIVIIYYSQSGNTKNMAELIKEGVEKEGGVDVDLKKVEDTPTNDLLNYNGIIIDHRLIMEQWHGKLKSCLMIASSSMVN